MSILNKNIEALKKQLIPEFLKQIIDSELPNWAESITSEDGTKNLLIKKGSTRKSLFQIKGYKEDIEQRIKDIEFKNSNATMIIGAGLGFFLKEIIDKAESKHIFILIEPIPGILKQALSNVDLTRVINDGQLFITPTTEDLSYFLEMINEKHVIDDWATFIESYTQENSDYQQISFDALAVLNQIRCNIGTVINAGSQIADNDISNLPYVIHKRGVKELDGLYAGLPAILVSTGPSLKKNIHILIENQNKAIIIAVGQALRPLLSYGITPDFICSVDYGEVNLTHYDGMMESDVPLVALNRSFAPLLKRWKGPMFVAASPQMDMHPDHKNRVHKILSEKGWTLQGGSVAHMCYGLGILLGCNPLIMIGQDLSYDSNQSHFAQADSGGGLKVENGDLKWQVKDPRCHLKNMDLFMGPPVPVQGYLGGTVVTNVGLASFITSFERFIKSLPEVKVVNATEGGAHIQGAKRMSLKRALETYCINDIEDKKERIKPLLGNCDNAMDLVNEAIPLLESEISLLADCAWKAKKAIDTNKKLKKLADKKGDTHYLWNEFNKQLKMNEEFSNASYNVAVKLPLVMLALYGATRKINHSSLNVKGKLDHLKDNMEDAKIRIERNRVILSAAITACKTLKASYKETLGQLKKASAANNISLLVPNNAEPLPNIDDAEEYFEAGNFARPLLEALRIQKTFRDNDLDQYKNIGYIISKAKKMLVDDIEKAKQLPDNSDLIDSIQLAFDAQEIGRKEKNFEKAKDMIQQAIDLCPDNELARWGLATAHFHTGDFEKSVEFYEKLCLDFPDKKRYLFEMGQVYVYHGETLNDSNRINNGIIKILEAMQDTEEFDSFLPIVGDLLCGFDNHDQAVVHYKEYLDKYPADYEVWKKLYRAELKLGNGSNAEVALDKFKLIKGE